MSDAAETLAEHLASSPPEGVISVYLFGSEATGQAHRESDVDVGVLFDREAVSTRGGREVRDLLLRAADLAPFLRRTRRTRLKALRG